MRSLPRLTGLALLCLALPGSGLAAPASERGEARGTGASGAARTDAAKGDTGKGDIGKSDTRTSGGDASTGKVAPRPLTAEAINTAAVPPDAAGPTPGGDAAAGKEKDGKTADRPDPLTIKLQVLLDRARFSPGVIDGRGGDNTDGALKAFAAANSLTGAWPDAGLLAKLEGASQGPVAVPYTVTQADADGPYVARVPAKMEAQADLDGLGYTGPREMLAERFHTTGDLLDALNPGKDLGKPGTEILVPGVAPMGTDKPAARTLPQAPKVARVEVDKGSRDVRAFGEDGGLLAYYPASIGSTEKPAPSGATTVKGVAFNPAYTYDPKYRFKGVKSRRKFSIKPGPNNPVGLVWIDLAIPSYGIHGTPAPENVGKTESHGCIRLTNWNARDLAAHVARGAKVVFKED